MAPWLREKMPAKPAVVDVSRIQKEVLVCSKNTVYNTMICEEFQLYDLYLYVICCIVGLSY